MEKEGEGTPHRLLSVREEAAGVAIDLRKPRINMHSHLCNGLPLLKLFCKWTVNGITRKGLEEASLPLGYAGLLVNGFIAAFEERRIVDTNGGMLSVIKS